MSDSVLSTVEQIDSVWRLGGLTWRELARRMWTRMNEDALIDRGYELAYNFLLALFPLLFFLVALIGAFASESSTLRAHLFAYLELMLPPSAFDLVAHTLNEVTSSASGGKLTFGLLFALYWGSAGMTQLISTLNAAYGVREGRSWIRVHLISLALTLGMSMLIVAALFLVLAGGHIISWIGYSLGMNALAVVAVKAAQWGLALGFVILAFAIVYYFAPDVEEQRWYWITPGSVVGVALWVIASAVLRGYLHFFNTYNKTYGSLGAVMILMLWFYVTGLAVLIGGEINATIEHAAAEHGHPEAKPEDKKAA